MFRTLESFDTVFSADSVEWCPAENLRDHFVCGTYQLSEDEEEDQRSKRKRLGRIYLFRVTENAELDELQRLEVPAVLDMKWAHAKWNGRVLLGVANSKGCLEIFELTDEGGTTVLAQKWKVRVREDCDDALALSLDWSSGRRLTQEGVGNEDLKIVVSDSRGRVSVFQVEEDEVKRVSDWLAHDFEAWIAAFDYWNTDIVYTGGDDCKFKRFDVRLGPQPTMISLIHAAGVTSLHSNAKREYLLTSGSYDEVLRTWDTRNFKQALGEEKLGGGIWRIKWEPFERRYLLAACMYDGFRVVDCQDPTALNIFATYKEHESIAYGCDWTMLAPSDIKASKIWKKEGSPTLIATCSFYDHVLKLSALELTE